MAQAFADISELELFAGQLADAANGAEDRVRSFIAEAAEDVAAHMADEVPVDSGETRDSITVEFGDDGMSASIGPTNTDEGGRPVGFFIEHGAGNRAPDPFVLRTSLWAESELPDRASEALRDVL